MEKWNLNSIVNSNSLVLISQRMLLKREMENGKWENEKGN